LIDVPEYRRRKAMALSPNIMRDASDKVSCQYSVLPFKRIRWELERHFTNTLPLLYLLPWGRIYWG